VEFVPSGCFNSDTPPEANSAFRVFLSPKVPVMETYNLERSAKLIIERYWPASEVLAKEFCRKNRALTSGLDHAELMSEAYLSHVEVVHSWDRDPPFDIYLSRSLTRFFRKRVRQLKRSRGEIVKGRLAETPLKFDPASPVERNVADWWETVHSRLTEQESKIALMLSQGETILAIADALEINRETVSVRIKSIRNKLSNIQSELQQDLFNSEEERRIKRPERSSGKQRAEAGERYAEHWRKVQQDAEKRERGRIDLQAKV